jgi:hypothetical protein
MWAACQQEVDRRSSGDISLGALAMARISLPQGPCQIAHVALQKVPSSHIGTERLSLKLTISKFAETFGNSPTAARHIRQHVLAAIYHRTPACGTKKLRSAASHVYDNVMTNCVSPELRTSKSLSC